LIKWGVLKPPVSAVSDIEARRRRDRRMDIMIALSFLGKSRTNEFGETEPEGLYYRGSFIRRSEWLEVLELG